MTEWFPAPTVEHLAELLHIISQRVASFLERRGLLERVEDNSYLTLDGLDEDPMQDIHTHSLTYRIAFGLDWFVPPGSPNPF